MSGEGMDVMNAQDISKGKLILCGVLGVLSDMLLISIYEWLTSHGCSPVRNMSYSSVNRIFNMNIIYANYLGNVAVILPLALLAITIAITHHLGGLVGLLFYVVAYVMSLYLQMPIYFVGATTSDSYKLTYFGYVNELIRDNL